MPETPETSPLEPNGSPPKKQMTSSTQVGVRIPSHYLSRMDLGNPRDPIYLQTVPQAAEKVFDPREWADPIGDERHTKAPGLVHRYPDRVLLFPTQECAVYCRHCFRKEQVGGARSVPPMLYLRPALAYLAGQPQVREVILTGGDPLLLSNQQLGQLRLKLEQIPHVRALRLHTRMPIVTPQRITTRLCAALSGKLMTTIVTHANHPQELCPQTVAAAQKLRQAGFLLLNQTVLLRGVNDDANTLGKLFEELYFGHGNKPYYLHHCDLTRGLLHFRTSIDRGLEIMETLRGRISGVCLPQYVLDLPGGHGKVPLLPSYVVARDGYRWVLRNHNGTRCEYEEVILENPPKVG